MKTNLEYLSALLGFFLPLYLIVIASMRGFFNRYTPFYIFLTSRLLLDFILWMTLLRFGYGSTEYRFIYYLTGILGILLTVYIVLYLYIEILKDYPSLRFTVGMFLLTSFIFLGSFILIEVLNSSQPSLAALYKKASLYFDIANGVLLAALSIFVLAFRLPIGLNLGGMLSGFTFSIVSLTTLQLLYHYKIPFPYSYITPFCYFTTLAIFVATLSAHRPGNILYVHPFLKLKVDTAVFLFLNKYGLWNRFTDTYFFKFFKYTMDFDELQHAK